MSSALDPKQTSADLSSLTFEEAMTELEEIVRALEGGDIGLESSIQAYERGALLRSYCESRLREAELKIEKIVTGADGLIGSEQIEQD